MRKLALVSALLLSAGAATVTTADARPYGRGYGAYNGGYAYNGGRGYYRGGRRGRRGIGTGAAVGLGIAGLAAGAIAAGAARDAYHRDNYYGGRRGYYDYGY